MPRPRSCVKHRYTDAPEVSGSRSCLPDAWFARSLLDDTVEHRSDLPRDYRRFREVPLDVRPFLSAIRVICFRNLIFGRNQESDRGPLAVRQRNSGASWGLRQTPWTGLLPWVDSSFARRAPTLRYQAFSSSSCRSSGGAQSVQVCSTFQRCFQVPLDRAAPN